MRSTLRKPARFDLLGGAACLVGLLGWYYVERISTPKEPIRFEWFPRLPREEALAVAHRSATSVGYKMAEYELVAIAGTVREGPGWMFIFHRKSPGHYDGGDFIVNVSDNGKITVNGRSLDELSAPVTTNQTTGTTQTASAPARTTLPIRGLPRRPVEEAYACARKAMKKAGLDPRDYGLLEFEAFLGNNSQWCFRFVSRDDPYNEFDIEVPDWWWPTISGTPGKPRHNKAATTQETRKRQGATAHR